MDREALIQEFRSRAAMFGHARRKVDATGDAIGAAYYMGREDAYYAASGSLADDRPADLDDEPAAQADAELDAEQEEALIVAEMEAAAGTLGTDRKAT